MRKLSALLFILALVLAAFLLVNSKKASAFANHVVISQVQIAGATADDEFVELYNPTNNPVDLSGWRLRRESQTTTTSSNLVLSMSGIIPSHGYFLVAFPGAYTGSVPADLNYTATSSAIAANNTVLLYSDAGVSLVDKVGMGTATDKETTAAPEPAVGGSIQRKIDDTGGHGLDTDNNNSDFEALAISTPRNSSVVITPTPTPSVTPTLTPTPSPTFEPTATPSPTTKPSSTPTPTLMPTTSPTPKNEPTSSPTPTLEPSATPNPTSPPTPTVSPTNNPTPTLTVEPSATPTLSPTPTPTPGGKVILSSPHLVCYLNTKEVNFFFFKISVPVMSCVRI